MSRGETVLCAKTCYQDPELVELVASLGFDGVWICMEHKRIDPATVYSLIQACRLGGADAIMRVKPSNYTDLLWLLESGARGLMIPRVTHIDEVRWIVDAIKFHPQGKRGYDGIHVESNFGAMKPLDYMAEANRENFLMIQIEETEVVPHIDAIAALPGVDVLFVGPGDLTLGMGKFGQVDDPEVLSILKKVTDACQKHGKIAAIPCAPDQVKKYQDLGFKFLNVISDFRCVSNGAKQALATAQGTLASKPKA